MITKVVKVTHVQMQTLLNGGTVAGHTYDPTHCLYIEDTGAELPDNNGIYGVSTSDNGETYQYVDLSSIYLTKTEASNTYLTKSDATSTYLTITGASNTYLSKTAASNTYLSKTDASNTYLSQTAASSIYLSKTDASNTYLSKTAASSTYLSKTDASNTYATKTALNNKQNKINSSTTITAGSVSGSSIVERMSDYSKTVLSFAEGTFTPTQIRAYKMGNLLKIKIAGTILKTTWAGIRSLVQIFIPAAVSALVPAGVTLGSSTGNVCVKQVELHATSDGLDSGIWPAKASLYFSASNNRFDFRMNLGDLGNNITYYFEYDADIILSSDL